MLTFLLVIQALVAVLLVGVILMQQSEGGGLGMGGSPTGLMSARGAADFLTRSTTILASIFIGLSILHAVLATQTSTVSRVDTSLARKTPTAPPPAPMSSVPLADQPTTVPPVSMPVPIAPVQTTPTPTPTPARSEPATSRVRVEREPARPARSESAPPATVTPTPVPDAAAPAPGNAN